MNPNALALLLLVCPVAVGQEFTGFEESWKATPIGAWARYRLTMFGDWSTKDAATINAIEGEVTLRKIDDGTLGVLWMGGQEMPMRFPGTLPPEVLPHRLFPAPRPPEAVADGEGFDLMDLLRRESLVVVDCVFGGLQDGRDGRSARRLSCDLRADLPEGECTGSDLLVHSTEVPVTGVLFREFELVLPDRVGGRQRTTFLLLEHGKE